MVLMYSLVARGSDVLLDAVHPLHTGNFKQVSTRLLQRVEQQSKREDVDEDDVEQQKDKQTLLFEGHLFHFVHRGSFWFMVMTDRSSGQTKPFNFLRAAIETYMRATNDGVTRLEGSSAKALSEALTLKLETFSNQTSDEEKQTINKTNSQSSNQPEEADTDQLLDPSRSKPSDDSILANTRRDLATVKNGILNNLDRVMSRGETLETLVDRSDELHSSAAEFKSQSTRLKRTMCLSNARALITLVILALLTIYGVVAFKCGVALNHCNT